MVCGHTPMKRSGIYEIRNSANGSRYIGSACNFAPRWSTHKRQLRRGEHHSKKLQAAWNKYGATAFEFRVIQECPKEQLLFQEQRAIHGFLPEYNISRVAGAPMTHRKHSEQTKARMATALKGNTRCTGYKHTAEQRAANTARQLGKKRTPEWCAAISAGKKGKSVAKRGPMPATQRAAISASRLGCKHPPEFGAAISARQKGKKLTPEWRAAISAGRQARRSA